MGEAEAEACPLQREVQAALGLRRWRDAWKARALMAGMPDDFAYRVNGRICVHTLEKGNFIHNSGKARIDLAHPCATLAVLFKVKHRRQNLTFLHGLLRIESLQVILGEDLRGLFASQLLELGFVIKGLQMTGPAAHKKQNHILRSGRVMR